MPDNSAARAKIIRFAVLRYFSRLGCSAGCRIDGAGTDIKPG
ncbi:MAG: hypothetical protein WC383_03795 [Gammaproteobacteria bacterium]